MLRLNYSSYDEAAWINIEYIRISVSGGAGCRYLSYVTVIDVLAGGQQSYLPLHRWLIATNNGGQQMVLLPPRNNSIE